MKRTARVVLLAIGLLLPAASSVSAQDATDDPIRARAFEVQYRPLVDAADVIDPLLSVLFVRVSVPVSVASWNSALSSSVNHPVVGTSSLTQKAPLPGPGAGPKVISSIVKAAPVKTPETR